MKQLTRGWAVLALTAAISGSAHAAVDVAPAPVHVVPDDADGAPPAPRQPVLQTASLSVGVPAGAQAVELAAQPTGPSVAIARSIVDAAGAFDSYMRSASGIDPNFTDGQAVARAVSVGSAYEPRQLQAGAVAYAALVALQDPLFVEVVSDVGQRPSGGAFAANLLADPSLVLEAPAARTEAVRVAAALGQAGARLLASGQAVKQSAYDIQHQPWSKGAIVAPDARLAEVKSRSSRFYASTPGDTTRLMSTVAAWRTVGGAGRGQAGYSATAVVTRGLALAALAILGQAGEDQVDRLAPLLTDADSAQCVKMAKLNLYQCLAVAGPHYEDAFCLGRHAMMDTGQCIVAAAGSTGADLTPAPRGELAQASVMVPIALAAGEQSERDSVFGPPAR